MVDAIKKPDIFYREYENDLEVHGTSGDELEAAKRVALVALPFVSLYKPASFPLAVVTGSLRTYTTTKQLVASIQSGDFKRIAYSFIQTAIAIICLASTFFAHPIGMLLSTGHDLILQLLELAKQLQKRDFRAAAESVAKVISNALY